MPELPELEVIVENLHKQIDGLKIISIEELDSKSIKGKLSIDKNLGLIKDVKRYGKYIYFKTELLDFYLHLMLSGKINITDKGETDRGRVVLRLSDGNNLYVVDIRRLAYLGVDIKDIPTGMDPFNKLFTTNALTALIVRANKKKLKSFLMDQDLIAGIGNAYSDEIMYNAKLNPAKRAGECTSKEIAKLHKSIKEVLLEAIKNIKNKVKNNIYFEEVRDFMFVHKRKDKLCSECGSKITTMKVDNKNTHYCPICQE